LPPVPRPFLLPLAGRPGKMTGPRTTAGPSVRCAGKPSTMSAPTGQARAHRTPDSRRIASGRQSTSGRSGRVSGRTCPMSCPRRSRASNVNRFFRGAPPGCDPPYSHRLSPRLPSPFVRVLRRGQSSDPGPTKLDPMTPRLPTIPPLHNKVLPRLFYGYTPTMSEICDLTGHVGPLTCQIDANEPISATTWPIRSEYELGP